VNIFFAFLGKFNLLSTIELENSQKNILFVSKNLFNFDA